MFDVLVQKHSPDQHAQVALQPMPYEHLRQLARQPLLHQPVAIVHYQKQQLQPLSQ